MATFVLIPGAGSDGWFWHPVVARLDALGHRVLAIDLPWDDAGATFADFADSVADAVVADRAERTDDGELVVVAQSLGAYVGPLVCDRVGADLLVLVAAMVPCPGEPAGQWSTNTGYVSPDPFDEQEVFLHDVPADLAAASADHVTEPSGHLFEDVWPLARWPDVPTRFLLCRDDRMFPADFQRRVARERLGISADEMGGGHLAFLTRPDELVEWLETYRAELAH